MSQDTHVLDVHPGFNSAEVLPPEVYRALRRLAASHMARQQKDRTLQTTVLVHEAWLRISKSPRKWRDARHFFATASVAMRHILIDYARLKSRQCRGGNLRRLSLDHMLELEAPSHTDIVLLIDEGISELEKHDPVRARVVVDRFFGGMTQQEIAGQLGMSERSVERHWAMAKVWLLRWIQTAISSPNQAVA